MRKAELSRKTRETDIAVSLDLDGKGKGVIETGIGFFDHMLTAFAVHGGVIMAIMEAYARPKKDFYAYHIGNGEWLQGVYDGETIQIK